MKIKGLLRLLDSLIALLLSVSGFFLAQYYFGFESKNTAIIQTVRQDFYGSIEKSWLAPDIDKMFSRLQASELQEYDRVVLTGAMKRWRLTDIAPHAFTNLLQDLNSGLWFGNFSDSFQRNLINTDSRWIYARNKALAKKLSAVRPDVVDFKEMGFSFKFPAETTSADVGSLLKVLVGVGPDSKPTKAVNILWETVQNPGVIHSRQNQATFEDTGQTSGGLRLYRLVLDMSASPEWLEPSTQPYMLHFRAEPPLQWAPFSYKFTDSSLLPVSSASKASDENQ